MTKNVNETKLVSEIPLVEENDMGVENTTAVEAAGPAVETNSIETLVNAVMAQDEALASPVEGLEERLERLARAQKSQDFIDEWGHKRTYRLLQAAYSDCLYIETERGSAEFAEVTTRRQVAVGQGKNRFLPMVKVMWGGFDETADRVTYEGVGNLVKWRHNRSAEKYANVFRYLSENDVPPETVADFIETFQHKTHGKKLDGIVQADVAAHREAVEVVATGSGGSLLSDRKMIHAFATVQKPERISKTEGLVYLVARVVGDELELLGDISIKDDVVKNELPKLAENLWSIEVALSERNGEEFRRRIKLEKESAKAKAEAAVATA